MPGLAEYLTAAQLGANLLALPQTLRQQGQGVDTIRQTLLAQGMTPEQVDAVAPQPLLKDFPGNNVPGLGQVLRGVGTVGQILQNVTGQAPAAPRLPLGQLIAMQQMQTATKKQEALKSLSDQYTNPRAKALSVAGYPGAAETAESGGRLANEVAIIDRISRLPEGDPERDRLQGVLDQLQAAKLKRAQATAGAGVGARLGGEAQGYRTDVPFFPEVGGGPARPQPQPQAGTPPPSAPGAQPMGVPAGSPRSAFQPAVYRVDESGAVQQVASVGSEQPTGAVSGLGPLGLKTKRLQLPGGSTLEFAKPEMSTEFEAMMRAQRTDPLTGTPEDAQRVLDNWQLYKRHEAQIKEAVAREDARLPDQDRNAIVSLRLFQDQVYSAMHDFTADERRRFAGYFKQGPRELAQIVLQDPRFAAWSALVGQIEAAKFGEGGKQLTEIEQYVVEKYIPTGREWGGNVSFEAKATDFLHRADFLIRERLRLATESGTQYRKEYEQLREKYLSPAKNAPAGAEIPSGADIEAAKKRLGIQ